MPALPGYKARVLYTGTPVAMTNEATTNGGDNKTFTITNALKRYIDDSSALTVETSPNGTTGWAPVSSGYDVQFVGGVIRFVSALTGTTPSVRLSGKYLPYSVCASAKSVELNTSLGMLDVSTFEGNGWKDKIPDLADASIKLGKWWVDSYFFTALDARKKMVISIYIDKAANDRFEGFALLKGQSLKAAIGSAQSEDLDFEVTGALYSILS